MTAKITDTTTTSGSVSPTLGSVQKKKLVALKLNYYNPTMKLGNILNMTLQWHYNHGRSTLKFINSSLTYTSGKTFHHYI